MLELNHKIALVTGAGRGIGRAIVQSLHDAGANVIAVARTRSDLEQLAEECPGIECWACDVTSDDFIQRLEALQTLDILVNNAGSNRPEPVEDVSDENLDAVLDLNVRTVFRVARAAVRVMKRANTGGAIINMSSQMGRVGSPGRTVYCMTKHAVEGLTKAMAVELGPDNIRVNAVAPTFIETPLTKPMLSEPTFREFVDRMIPLGRIGQPADVAEAVKYLATAQMVTGTSLLVDGGWTAH